MVVTKLVVAKMSLLLSYQNAVTKMVVTKLVVTKMSLLLSYQNGRYQTAVTKIVVTKVVVVNSPLPNISLSYIATRLLVTANIVKCYRFVIKGLNTCLKFL